MTDELDAARLRIAERKRAELDAWRDAHPHAAMDAALRAAAREAMKHRKSDGTVLDLRDSPAGIPLAVPTADAIREAEDSWVRFHVAREVLLAGGRKATDAEVAASLNLGNPQEAGPSDPNAARTIRRWREDWRRAGLPETPRSRVS